MNQNTSIQTAAALARLLAGLVVIVAAWLGVDLDADIAESAVIAVIALGALAYLWWWKDNPVTKAARTAHALFLELKARSEEDEAKKELAAEAAEEESAEDMGDCAIGAEGSER